jgi:5-hydroxyisourate hydrolase-like protein (transthyretin family)
LWRLKTDCISRAKNVIQSGKHGQKLRISEPRTKAETRNAKIEIRKSKLETGKWKLETGNGEGETRNWKLGSKAASFHLPVSIFEFRFSTFQFPVFRPFLISKSR